MSAGPTMPPPDPATPSDGGDAAKKPWWQRWYTLVGAGVVLLLIIAGIAGGGSEDDGEGAADTTTAVSVESSAPAETSPGTTEATPPTTEAPTTTEATTTTSSSTSTTTTTGPAPEFFPPVVFTGSGQQVIVIDDGSPAGSEPGVAELTHDGGSNFQVTLLDADGERIDGLVNEIGPYAGRRPWALRSGDLPRFIEVNADGNWSITVFDLLDVANQRIVEYAPGVSYQGLGDDVFFLFGGDGPTIMDFVCSNCDSNIQATAYSDRSNGLINEIGDGGEFQASVVLPAGNQILEVVTHGRTTPGNWVATFQ